MCDLNGSTMVVNIASQRVRSCCYAIFIGLVEIAHGKNHKLAGSGWDHVSAILSGHVAPALFCG